MIAPRKTAKFCNEKDITIYYTTLQYRDISCDDIDEDYIRIDSTGYLNITASKSEKIGSYWNIIDPLDWFVGKITQEPNVADNRNNYETCIFYTNLQPMSNYTTLVGVQRPKNKLYPTFLDFTGLAYSSLFRDTYVMATKAGYGQSPNVYLKPFIINQSGSYIAKMLTRKDKFYFNAADFTIRNQSDDSEFKGMPDINIFKPSNVPTNYWRVNNKDDPNPDYNTENMGRLRKSVCRQWANIKYYASHLKTEKYVENKEKFKAYAESLLGKNHTLISLEPININTTPKEDFMRYICEHGIPEYYHDYNNDFIFTVDNKKYTFDFDLEIIKDENFNTVPYIRTFNRVITMEEYTEIVKDFITIEQTDLIDDIRTNLGLGDYDFSMLYYPQYTNPSFSEGQQIQTNYSTKPVLKYTKKDGFLAIDTGGLEGIDKALTNRLNLIDYKDGVLSFNTDRSVEVEQTIDYSNLSLLFFELVTSTNNINVDLTKNPNLKKYHIYLHEKYTSNKDSGLDQLEFLPVLVFEGVTSMNTAVLRVETTKFSKTYIDKSERWNYKTVKEDEKGYYVYMNTTTPTTEPQPFENYIIENEDGTFKYITKYFYYKPEPEVAKQTVDWIEDLTKFRLPTIEFILDRRIKTLINRFKNNEIQGWFLKYKDTFGRTRIKLHQEDGVEFMRKTCDVTPEFIDIMPLVPFFSTHDAIIPCNTKTRLYKLPLRALAAQASYHYFYYVYDRKVTAYYKSSYKFPIKQWDRSINHNRFIDKDYKVKTPRRVSKVYTDKKLPLYNPSILQHPMTNEEKANKLNSIKAEYESFFRAEGHGMYGAHTAVRFTFAIYFNKYVRKAKLLNKMAIQYLEYYHETFNGIINVPFQMFVYPCDRVSYPEKRLLLRFTKIQLSEREIRNLKAKYYSEFDYYNGTITFYDKRHLVKYVLDMNRLYPNWKSTFFPNRIFTKKLNLFDHLTITKDDISPLKFTDSFTTTNPRYIPVDVYKKIGNTYTLDVESYYYNTPIVIKYTTQSGETRTRTLKIWKNAIEYRCFYTPYNMEQFNSFFNIDALSTFQDRNVYTYLTKFFRNMDYTVIQQLYNELFKKSVVLEEEYDNIFDYNKMFSKGFMNPLPTVDPNDSNEDNVLVNKTLCNIQEYDKSNQIHLNLAMAQTSTLYSTFKSSNLVNSYISKEDCIKEMIEWLLANELPNDKIITIQDFKHYFIDYDKTNSFLSKIMTDREVYELGFENYLVSDDVNSLEDISEILPKIQMNISKFIESMDLNNNYIKLTNYWLPLPIDAYKKFPFYCKKYVTTYFSLIESYVVRPIPMYDSYVWTKHRPLAIAKMVIGMIIAIVVLVVSIIFFQPEGFQLVLLILSTVLTVLIYAIQIAMLFLPADMVAELQKLVKGLKIASAVIGMVGGISGGISGNLNWMQVTNMALASINFCLEIAMQVDTMIYQAKINKEYDRLNKKIDEYNKSVDDTMAFLKENEFSEELNLANPTNIMMLEHRATSDKYSEFYEEYVQVSLDKLYTDLDGYYEKRLD